MKGKRLIKYIGGAALVGVLALSALALPVSDTETAQAATLSGVVFSEEFASQKLSNQWLKNDFTIDTESYYSMRMENQTDYGSAMLYVDYEIHDDCVISFDFSQTDVNVEKERDNWFGILLGYDDDSAHFTGGNAAILAYGRSQTQLMDDGDGTSDKLVADSYNHHTKFGSSMLLDAKDKTYTVELVLSYTGTRYADGENLYQVDGYYYEKSGERSLVPKFSYKGIAADGYFGFSAMASATLDVSNLKVTENGVCVVEENFKLENGEGKKILPNYETSAWRGINCSESKVYTYFNGSLDASETAEGLLLSNYNLLADTFNEKTFEITLDAKIAQLPENGAFGIAMGLDTASQSVREGSFIGLRGVSEDAFQFVYMVKGETVTETSAISKRLLGNGEVSISFIGYYDGTMQVKCSGYTASFENAAVGGYVGFATCGESACAVKVDNFIIRRSDYVSTNASNMAIDFSGVKEIQEEDYVYVERYVDERIWFVGSGVGFPKIYREDANYIQFIDSNERTFFGPKQTYSEFICRFSITVMENKADVAGSYIGLNFGKENRNDDALNSPGVLFAPTEEGMILQGRECTVVGGDSQGILKQYETYPHLNFWSAEDWKKEAVTYRIMVVVRGGNAYVYYANEADMSEMNVCKAVLTDMETSGYITVSALGGATFRLHDLSVTNIAVQGKAETLSVGANETDNEYVNVNFNNSALYTVSGTTTELGRGLSLGYASAVTVNEQYTDFLAYVDVNSVAGDGLEVKVGEQFIRLNADGTVYSQMKQIGGSGRFDFSGLKNGGVIMLEVMGKQISVSVVGGDQPTDLLEDPVGIFELKDRVKTLSVSVATVSETVLSLESIRLYTLNPTIAIEADNWEIGDTELPEKNTPEGEETTGGCFSVMSCGALLPVMALAAAVISKKKEARDE